MFFLNPLFLLGLSALAGPILLHMLLRDHSQRYILPTLRFLPASSQNTMATHRLKNLLLLLLRLLILALIVMAFSRPIFESKNSIAPSPEQPGHAVVFAVDTSFSMQSDGVWKQMQNTIKSYLNAQPPETWFALVTFDAQARLEVPPTNRSEDVLSALKELEPGFMETDLEAALRAASEAAESIPAKEKKIYLVSDFQQSAIRRMLGNPTLPSEVELVPISMSTENQSNAAVGTIRDISQENNPKRHVLIQIHNFSDGNLNDAIEVRDGDKVLTQIPVSVNSHSMEIIDTELDLPRDQEFFLRVDIKTKDALSADNSGYAVLPAKQPFKTIVLMTEGERRNPYIVAAINAWENRAETTWLFSSELNTASLNNYTLVIIDSPNELSPETHDTLIQYTQAGGRIILFPSESPTKPFGGFLPVRSDGWSTRDPHRQKYHLATASLSRSYRELHDLLGYPKIYTHLKISIQPNKGTENIIALDNGDSFLIHQRIGTGEIYAFTVPPRPTATDLVLRSSFSPFLYQLANPPQETASVQLYKTGENFPLPADRQQKATLIDPDGNKIDLQSSYVFQKPGFHRLTISDKPLQVAVCIPTEESDLRSLNAEELQEWAYGISRVQSKNINDLSQLVELNRPEPQPDEPLSLWKYLLFGVLGLMLCETLLASRTRK